MKLLLPSDEGEKEGPMKYRYQLDSRGRTIAPARVAEGDHPAQIVGQFLDEIEMAITREATTITLTRVVAPDQEGG